MRPISAPPLAIGLTLTIGSLTMLRSHWRATTPHERTLEFALLDDGEEVARQEAVIP